MIVRPFNKIVGCVMFDWNDLRYFLAIAREGSTLSAAKALGVSQPTVQRRLAALEERIDRKLVEHHPTGYRLTELGTALFPHAEEVERSVATFQRQVTSDGKGAQRHVAGDLSRRGGVAAPCAADRVVSRKVP